MREGKLFIISGASGVGKSTVLNMVMSARDDLRFSVSATTRKPRPGEQDGVQYYFVTAEQFQEMVEQNAFLEYDTHMNNSYGTPRFQVEEKVKTGHVILDIEPNGAFAVKEKWPDAKLIFIAPPSQEELERRLRSRGDTPEDQVLVRLNRAAWEMTQKDKYDIIVINDEAKACADRILNFIAENVND